MNTIFGIPADTLMVALLLVFGLCLAIAAWIMIRNRFVFRMAVRNIPRRPAQTILIVLGLMLSTTIIAAALTTGDIMQHTIRTDVFNIAGHSDEFVVRASEDDEQARPQLGVTIPESVYHDLREQVGQEASIDGLMPVLTEAVPVLHPAAELGEPSLLMVGLDFAEIDAFQDITTLDGTVIDVSDLASNQAILGETPAGNLGADPGDLLTMFVQGQPFEIEVAAIAADTMFTGMNDAGQSGGFAMNLDAVQELTGQADQISFVSVSNQGGVADGLELTDDVVEILRSSLDGSEYNVIPVKQQSLETAEEFAAVFSSIFMVFGMFSIAAGILLIFLIFVLLAAERKPEMGISRAIGMKRRHVTQMFITEGLAYDLAAALIGALLGIGVAIAMVGTMTSILADQGFQMQPTASWRSLTIAYTLGVTVTFITIVISAWRVSRLNIVSAVRNLPDQEKTRRSGRSFVLAVAGLGAGVVLAVIGYQALNPFLFGLGVSLAPFAIAFFLVRAGFPGRPLYSVASALVLVYWIFPTQIVTEIIPDMSTGGMEMFILSGIVLVASATVLIMWNADLITRGIALLSHRFSRWTPAVKTAVSYPMANRSRTGLTIAMFSLIIFSLVVMASINLNFSRAFEGEHATAGWDIQLMQPPNNPIENLGATLDSEGFDSEAIAATGRLQQTGAFQSEVRYPGDDEWGNYPIMGADERFIDAAGSAAPISIKATGYETDEEVWDALHRDPTLAVIDGLSIPSPVIIRTGTNFALEGVAQGSQTMEPVEVEIRSRISGEPETVTIIGAIDPRVSIVYGMILGDEGYARLYDQPQAILHYVAMPGADDAIATAETMEKLLVPFGVQAQSTREILRQSNEQSRGFLYLFEGFMGLGLIIGIAALGVVSFRSVVERRQQIGMLRAIGYRRSMLAASFVLESTIVTVLGVISGITLGLLLSWQLMGSETFSGTLGGAGFMIPWVEVLIFAGIAILASLMMAWIPARQAARVPIAESLRYE